MSEKEMLDFDSAIDPEEINKPKQLLPEGEAFFTVVELKRARRAIGSLGVCNVADFKLLVTPLEGEQEPAEVEDSLPLHPDMLWKALQFFTAIGQREHGDKSKFVPKWDGVDGTTGRCVIAHRAFKRRNDADGEKTGIANQIVKYLAEGEEYKPAEKKAEPKTATTKPKRNF